MIQYLAQHTARDVERLDISQRLLLEREEAASGIRTGSIFTNLREPLRGPELVVTLRVDVELEPVTNGLDEPLLEHAQRHVGRGIGREAAQRLVVVDEQLRLRIVARRQVDDQFVEIETGQHLACRQIQEFPIRLRGRQLRGVTAAGPGYEQWTEWHQQRGELRFRSARAARKQGQPPVLRREYVEDAAGVAILAMMQHESRLECDAFARLHGNVLFHPQLRKRASVVGPVLAHLDPEIEVQALAEPGIEFFARLLADALETRALGADHDRLLSRAI